MTLRIEAWGTFDVANTGDLLYPVVLEHELRRRAGNDNGRAFGGLGLASPIGGIMPLGGTRPVRRVIGIEEMTFADQAGVDGIVLGGGDILRAGPEPAADFIPDATGLYRYDLFLGELTVLAAAIPVVWNGVGVPLPFDADGATAVRLLASRAHYVSVRDELSRRHLEDAGVATEIAVVPDPALALDRAFARDELRAASDRLRTRDAYPRSGRVLAVHASFTTAADEHALVDALRAVLRERAEVSVAFVPLGPCHGDVPRMRRMAEAMGPRAVAVDGELTLVELVAAIAHADAFVGSSLHGQLIAARYGIPGAFLALATHQPAKLHAYADLLGRADLTVDTPARLPRTTTELLDGCAPVDTGRIARLASEVDVHYDRLAAALFEGEPDENVRATLRRRADGFDQAAAPARSARRAADAMLAGHVRRLSADLRAAIDAHDEVQQHADELAGARDALHARLQELAARGRALIVPSPTAEAAPVCVVDLPPSGRVLALDRMRSASLQTTPYQWGVIDNLYDAAGRRALIDTFPTEPFATIAGHDGEKGYEYEARCLVAMGGTAPWRPDRLSESWFRLATDLCSRAYRATLSAITGCSLDNMIMEANAFHYGPGAWLGPHIDLPEKILTHILYFNEEWDPRAGGCLRVLRSGDDTDMVAEVPPIAGSSVVLVRSEVSWHAVTRVVPDCDETRRSVTVTFYPPGSISTMWPPGQMPALHCYPPASVNA